MFKIQTFVGRKYGMWHDATARYDEKASAETAIMVLSAAETTANATRLTRRIVQA